MVQILIVGGAGFVGAHVTEQAVAAGHRVRLFDTRPPSDALQTLTARAEFVTGDVRDREALATAAEGCPVIVNCAAIVGPIRSREAPEAAFAVNVGGTFNVLELARGSGARIVNLSTATLYGNRPELGVLTEDSPPDPVSLYDATKLMGETLCATYRKTYGVVACSIRTGFVYGMGSGIGQYFVPAALAGQPVTEEAGIDHPCDFTYVVDLASGILRAVEAERLPHSVYNVTTGVLRTRGEFAAIVRRELPQAAIAQGPGRNPKLHIRGPCDVSRAAADLGYRPRFTLETGIPDWIARMRGR
ncbi:MAG: NAD(P)-dependent oxidoreductase [Alphaproteobacteria bacterium]|nr:NAD(P)-dependent oxidoreductase [Alphaproteobacteria bacterium]